METVTPEQLVEIVKPYCIQKMLENTHKTNPFELDFDRLSSREMEERTEKVWALIDYINDPTPENRDAALYEIGDTINFLLFQAGKLLGLSDLVRGDP